MTTYTVEGYKRLNRRDSVTGEFTKGPWHSMTSLAQAWCGSKVRGFNAEHRRAGEKPEGRHCAACQKAVADGQPKPFRRR